MSKPPAMSASIFLWGVSAVPAPAVPEGRNHRFEGNQDGLFRALREGLEWIRKTAL